MTGHIYDPIALGESVARTALHQDRRRGLTAINGGRRPDAVVPGRMAHPSAQPAPVLYDRTQHPDTPTLPLIVATALSVLVRNVMVPGSVERPPLVEAAEIVTAHFLARPDDAPPHGYPRPGAS